MPNTGDNSGRDPGSFFRQLLPQSKLAVSMALAILDAEGLEGWMMVYIPPDKKAPCEVLASTGGWNLSMDPGQFVPRSRKRTP